MAVGFDYRLLQKYKPKKKRPKTGVVAKKYKAPAFTELQVKTNPFVESRKSTLALPSAPLPPPRAPEFRERLEGEMAAREAAAQAEIARKAKCVAPLYSKGAYQYVATEEQAKWIGRK